MINWSYFPKNMQIPIHFNEIISTFNQFHEQFNSTENNYSSDEVLHIVGPTLSLQGYEIEKSKKFDDKIRIPVLFGEKGKESLAFEADGYSRENNTVIEVEAGRAVTNYQFLKDFYQASMMINVDYLCIAVRNIYRKNNDYKKVCDFFEAMFVSGKISTPLKGILIIGY